MASSRLDSDPMSTRLEISRDLPACPGAETHSDSIKAIKLSKPRVKLSVKEITVKLVNTTTASLYPPGDTGGLGA